MPQSFTNTLKLECSKKGIWYVTGYFGSQRIRFSTKSRSKSEAHLILSEFVLECEAKRKKKKEKQATFSECAEIHKRMCTKKTKQDDLDYIDDLEPYIGNLLMGDICIRPQETDGSSYDELHPLNKFIYEQSKRNITQNTINKKISFLNALAIKSIKEYNILSHREWVNVRTVNTGERIFFGFNR